MYVVPNNPVCDTKQSDVSLISFNSKQEPVRVVVDEITYWRQAPPRSKLILEDPSKDYGFPEDEVALLNSDGTPRDRTLVRCYPAVGVFSLRDKAWGKFELFLMNAAN